MKLRKIEVEISFPAEGDFEAITFIAGDSYDEPETLADIAKLDISEADKIRAFQYGLYSIKTGQLRSQNNFASLARQMFKNKLFGSVREAFEFIVRRRENG